MFVSLTGYWCWLCAWLVGEEPVGGFLSWSFLSFLLAALAWDVGVVPVLLGYAGVLVLVVLLLWPALFGIPGLLTFSPVFSSGCVGGRAPLEFALALGVLLVSSDSVGASLLVVTGGDLCC